MPRPLKRCRINYDLGIEAYNDLRVPNVSTPRILVLHVQPKEKHERFRLTVKGAILAGLCYWISLRGYPASPNRRKIRIAIPKGNVLSDTMLTSLMRRVRTGELL